MASRRKTDDALVMANRMHAVGGAAHEEPTRTVTTAEAGNQVVVQMTRANVARLPEREPIGTVRGGGEHHGVVVANYGAASGPVSKQGWARPADAAPFGGITCTDSHSLVVPYARASLATPGDTEPMPTLTTRDRVAIVVPETLTGNEAPADPREWTDDAIADCRFRMFTLPEIARAMQMQAHHNGGEYVVTGNKREKMAQYGNAVTPPVMALLVGRLLDALTDHLDDGSVTDLFCGAGGSSLGAEIAGAKLRLGLNHWRRAIETHSQNFQDADHDCADISALSQHAIRRYPCSDIFLASPECTNHSLAKGALRRKPQGASLFDDGPGNQDEQDRSRATMWDVPRFVEMKQNQGRPYKAIVVENVVDAFKWGYEDDGNLFAAWRQAVEALGYQSQIVWLNSMFAPPTPQSRDRMYVVFWKRGLPAPDLDIRPTSWCPSCEKVVDGVQTWKKPGAIPWGRYGIQYVYGCPDCRAIVLPGAYTASSAIDWSVEGERIGDRARPLATNTIERIRRGLTRLDQEPFAIRLAGSGYGAAPRPTTLPLVTLTGRQDLGLVMPGRSAILPVSACTHENTPGNRAKDPAVTPLPTQSGSLDKAIVVPPSTGAPARIADREQATTQTTEPRMSIVTTTTENAVPRRTDTQAMHTVTTQTPIAVVEP